MGIRSGLFINGDRHSVVGSRLNLYWEIQNPSNHVQIFSFVNVDNFIELAQFFVEQLWIDPGTLGIFICKSMIGMKPIYRSRYGWFLVVQVKCKATEKSTDPPGAWVNKHCRKAPQATWVTHDPPDIPMGFSKCFPGLIQNLLLDNAMYRRCAPNFNISVR